MTGCRGSVWHTTARDRRQISLRVSRPAAPRRGRRSGSPRDGCARRWRAVLAGASPGRLPRAGRVRHLVRQRWRHEHRDVDVIEHQAPAPTPSGARLQDMSEPRARLPNGADLALTPAWHRWHVQHGTQRRAQRGEQYGAQCAAQRGAQSRPPPRTGRVPRPGPHAGDVARLPVALVFRAVGPELRPDGPRSHAAETRYTRRPRHRKRRSTIVIFLLAALLLSSHFRHRESSTPLALKSDLGAGSASQRC
jgi:hypothetical protein